MDKISSKNLLSSCKTYGVIRRNVTFPKFHMHRRIEIVLVTEGELTMQVNRDVYSITPGHAVFIDAYDGHSFKTYDSSVCAIIEFFPEFCREVYAPFYRWLSSNTITNRVISIPKEIFGCVISLLPKDEEKIEYYDELPSRFFAILAPLFHAIMENSETVPGKKQYDDLYMRAAEYIVLNYDNDLSRSVVASAIGVRPESLSRIFARRMHMTFTEYVQYVRLTYSLRKIESGEKISSAALSSGFDSIRSYNRVFKSFFEKSPREYLNSL